MNTSLSNLKNIYRKKYHSIRLKVLPSLQEEIFNQTLKALEKRQKVGALKKYIGIYWPLAGEVDLRDLRKVFNAHFALPASSSEGQINYHKWQLKDVEPDLVGIPSSLSEPQLKPEDLSLLIVPAIAIDSHGYRLGYGGGFFDRLRGKTNWRRIPSLVVLPKVCISMKVLPNEKWDIPFDGWITEEGEFSKGN